MDLYSVWMETWSQSILFSRQQISRMSGVPDGVLSFWIKSGLLVSSSGGEGRGKHRRFSPIQVTFAAVLGKLQQFGLNIGALGSFATLLQRGAALCENERLHPFSMHRAMRYVTDVASAKSGKSISIFYYQDGKPSDRDPSIRETTDPVIITRELMLEPVERDLPELILAFAGKIGPEDFDAIQSFCDIRYEMIGNDISDHGWLIWQDESGGWKISSQTEPREQFVPEPCAETAIFLGIGRIIRRVWSMSLDDRRASWTLRRIAQLRQSHPQIAEALLTEAKEAGQIPEAIDAR